MTKRGYNETGGWLSLGSQKPIEGDGWAIEGNRIEGSIEALGTGARIGCKGISSSSAIFEKCHRRYYVW
jgi:hypothetical protein